MFLQPKDDAKISFRQILEIVRKNKKKIFCASLLSALVMMGWRLASPLGYEAEGVFREKMRTPNQGNSSSIAFTLVAGMNGEGQSEGKVLMLSPVLLSKVIDELHLQAVIREESLIQRLIRRMHDNIAVEINYLKSIKKKAPEFPPTPLLASSLRFKGEYPLEFTLKFTSEENFEVNGLDGLYVGVGHLGWAFETPEYSFTIVRQDQGTLSGKTYNLKLLPLLDVMSDLKTRLTVQSEKGSQTLIKLNYYDQNAAVAADLVNAIMKAYQGHLKSEQQRIASEQVHYLHGRQMEMNQDLGALLYDYSQSLEADLATFGYAETDTAIKFFSDQFQELHKRMQQTDLELQRLEAVLDAPSEKLIDAYLSIAEAPRFMMELIESLVTLRRESHTIGLSSLEEAVSLELQEMLHQQIARLKEIETSRKELSQLIVGVDKEFSLLLLETLSESSQYMLKEWLEKWNLLSNQEVGDKQSFKKQFLAYLHNLDRHLEMHEKIVKEALSYQHNSPEIYADLSLTGAQALLETYYKQLADVEHQIVQNSFLIEQVHDPRIELHALTSLMQDSAIKQSIQQSHDLAFYLQDESNRSTKERERIQKELSLKRRFFASHIEKMHDLAKLHRLQLRNNIQQLQKKRFVLLQEKIALLENQFKEAVKTRLRNQKEEKDVLQERAEKLKEELVLLPKRWIAEKTTTERLAIHTKMLEEVSKLVESKNINNNLETIQSALLVPAIKMTHPRPPHLLLYLFVGLILGAIVGSAACIASRVLKQES